MNVRQSVGTVGCLCCGELIPVKGKEGGALSVSCNWCDLSAYAKPGTQAFRLISDRLSKAGAPDPVVKKTPAAAAPAAAAQPAPAAKVAPARSTIFG